MNKLINLKKASTNVLCNGDFYYIRTMSIGGLKFAEPQAQPYYHDMAVDDATLGENVYLALLASRVVSASEFQQIFNSGVVQQCGKERDEWMVQHYGYKTKRQLYRRMNRCDVELRDNKLSIEPTHHDSLDGWRSTKGQFEDIILSPDVSYAELGAAIKEGLSRCTSSVK